MKKQSTCKKTSSKQKKAARKPARASARNTVSRCAGKSTGKTASRCAGKSTGKTASRCAGKSTGKTARKPAGTSVVRNKNRRDEEKIISTICGNTTACQKKVSTEWVALASGVHDIAKVRSVTDKFGLKSTDKEIDLSGKENMRKSYGEIVARRQKELLRR